MKATRRKPSPTQLTIQPPSLIVHGYREKKYESLIDGRISIERGHVEFVDPHTVEVNGKHLSGDKVEAGQAIEQVFSEEGVQIAVR